jgi:succinyl-diaminopimelate desuccinylase
MPRADSALDLTDDVVTLTAALCDIESVSKGEAAIADAIGLPWPSWTT